MQIFAKAILMVTLFTFIGLFVSPTDSRAADVQSDHCERLFREKVYNVNRRLNDFSHEEIRWLVPWLDSSYDGCEIERIEVFARAERRNGELELFNGFQWTGFPEDVHDTWTIVRFDLFHASEPLMQEDIAFRARGNVTIQWIRLIIKQ